MNKIHKLQAITELIPRTNYEGITSKVFTWIENQLILLLVSAWLIAGGVLLLFLHVLKWFIDLFVKVFFKLRNLLPMYKMKGHYTQEEDPTHLKLPNINLN